jgi:hypothetical protein
MLGLRPKRVLEISLSSASGQRYGRLVADCQHRVFGEGHAAYVDRVDVEEKLAESPGERGPYRKSLALSVLDRPENLREYDLIVLADVWEWLDFGTASALVAGIVAAQAKTSGLLMLCQNEAPVKAWLDEAKWWYNETPVSGVPRDVAVYFLRGAGSEATA